MGKSESACFNQVKKNELFFWKTCKLKMLAGFFICC
jgi:hypothetical protein